jgi:hypothetical protein
MMKKNSIILLIIIIIILFVILYYYNQNQNPNINLNPNKTVEPFFADASSCPGFDCTIDNQKCMSPVPGSSFKNWKCNNKKWTTLTDGANITYKGCYVDKPDRALPSMYHVGVKSLDECYNYALQNEFDVFGLQAKENRAEAQCWAGKQSKHKYDKHGPITCASDGGDNWTNQVYTISPNLPYKYMGSYGDAGFRAVPNFKGNDAASVDECYNIAKLEGADVFSLQYGEGLTPKAQCFIGNQASSDYAIYGEKNCKNINGCAWQNHVYVVPLSQNTPAVEISSGPVDSVRIPWWDFNNMTAGGKGATWYGGTKWIGASNKWVNPNPVFPSPGRYVFTKTFNIDPSKIKNLETAILYIIVDNFANVWLNNNKVTANKQIFNVTDQMPPNQTYSFVAGGGWGAAGVAKQIALPLTQFLQKNSLVIEVMNVGLGINPAGVIANLILTYKNNQPADYIITDKTWMFIGNNYIPQTVTPLPAPLSGVTSIRLQNDNATNVLINGTYVGRPLQISQLAVYAMVDGVETNIATKGTATSKSAWGDGVADASNAIDGVLEARVFAAKSGFHSGGDNPEWWNLALDKPYDIHKIVYYNRADCCAIRAQGVEVQIFNSTSTTIPIFTSILSKELIQTIQISSPVIPTQAPTQAPTTTQAPIQTQEQRLVIPTEPPTIQPTGPFTCKSYTSQLSCNNVEMCYYANNGCYSDSSIPIASSTLKDLLATDITSNIVASTSVASMYKLILQCNKPNNIIIKGINIGNGCNVNTDTDTNSLIINDFVNNNDCNILIPLASTYALKKYIYMFDKLNGEFQTSPQITQKQLNSIIKNNSTITLMDIQNNILPIKVSIPQTILDNVEISPSVTINTSTLNKVLAQGQVINGNVNAIKI